MQLFSRSQSASGKGCSAILLVWTLYKQSPGRTPGLDSYSSAICAYSHGIPSNLSLNHILHAVELFANESYTVRLIIWLSGTKVLCTLHSVQKGTYFVTRLTCPLWVPLQKSFVGVKAQLCWRVGLCVARFVETTTHRQLHRIAFAILHNCDSILTYVCGGTPPNSSQCSRAF